MTKRRPNYAQRNIERCLRAAGVEYHIEIGKKHRKLFIAGQMVMVFSHGTTGGDSRQIEKIIKHATS